MRMVCYRSIAQGFVWFASVCVGLLLAQAVAAAPVDEAQLDAQAARITQHDRRLDGIERPWREHLEESKASRLRFEGWLRDHETRVRATEEKQRILEERLRKIDQRYANTAERLEKGERRVDGELVQLREQQVGTEQRLVDLLTNRTFGIAVAVLVIALASVGGLIFLRSSVRAAQSGLGARAELALSSMRSAEERLAQADIRLVGALTEQLERVRSAAQAPSAAAGEAAPAATGLSASADQEPSDPAQLRPQAVEHTLAIRLADELFRMRRRLVSLPEETRGVVPLRRSIERLETELADHGYELVDLTGRPYVDGMTMEARFIPDDTLASGQRVISRVVAPQVNYRGALVRMAEVEVGLGG